MDKPKTTAKDFFLWLGAMVTFYWSVTATILLIFNYINYLLPNPLSYFPSNPYQSGISYEMASIIVMLPIFVYLMHLIRKDIAVDPSRKEIWVRRWALILTLFVAGIAMAADLITLLTTFLNGEELSLAFILKVLIIFGIAAKVFAYFILDLKGYWEQHPGRRRFVIVGVGVFAVAVIVAGFFIVGSPQQARLMRFDEQKSSDLQNIQSQVIYYWQGKQQLPKTLSDLTNVSTYSVVPSDPQTNAPYIYTVTGPLSFELCADFNAKGQGNRGGGQAMTDMAFPAPTQKGGMPDYYTHDAGTQCFEQTIDADFYPPLNR
jgi:hypothetical protein